MLSSSHADSGEGAGLQAYYGRAGLPHRITCHNHKSDPPLLVSFSVDFVLRPMAAVLRAAIAANMFGRTMPSQLWRGKHWHSLDMNQTCP